MGTASSPGVQPRTRAWAVIVVGALIGALATALPAPPDASTPAVAAPGDPGEPAPPTVVYDEGFENAPDSGFPLLLTSYVSSVGGTYTADPAWASYPNCNGFIMSTTNTQSPGSCGNEAIGYASLRKLAYALGTINGSADAGTNSINAAYTYNNAANNAIEFETVTPIQLATPSRYLTFSVNAAATNCYSYHPRLQFHVRSGSPAVETPLGGVIDPCSDPRSQVLSTGPITGGSTQPYRGGSFPASASFVTTSSSIGIVMRNLTGTGAGNDGAFDDIRILDVTPSLDKSFSMPDISGRSRLTLTVTNTDELASKLGWSATDTLQPGLVVASPSNASSTCANGSVTATSGASTISVAGDLTTGMAFCTFTVDVTTATTPTLEAPQSYQNCASDLSPLVGLDPPDVCATVTFFAPPQLQIDKTTTATTASKAGDTVTYAVTLSNIGGTAYTVAQPASFSDDLAGILDDAAYNGDATASGGAPPPTYSASTLSWTGPLAAGASVTVSYSVELTLAGDGVLQNTATVPDGPSATSTVAIPLQPALSLVKSATPSDEPGYVLGAVISYAFVITNTGNVAITDLSLTEDQFTGVGPVSTFTCAFAPVLMPGSQVVCTATYTLQQPDIDQGGVDNAATARGVDPDGAVVVSNQSSVATPAPATPALTIEKSASDGPFTSAGDLVAYSFLITNTGNVTLTEVGVAEEPALFTGSGVVSLAACPTTTLIPGATVTCTATYPLTQQDVDQGTVENSATAVAVSPADDDIESAPSTAVVTVAAVPSLSIVKTAGPGGFTRAGEVVSYSFVVVNTGNVTLTDIAVEELTFTGTGGPLTIACPAGSASLAPGDDVTCTADYSLTQSDIDSGSIANSAMATAAPPVGPRTSAMPSPVQIAFVAAPALAIDKTSSRATVTASGQSIDYTFVVTNSGNVTIRDVSIAEGTFTGTGAFSAIRCPAAESAALPPGSRISCTATYTTTQDDIDGSPALYAAATRAPTDTLFNTAAATGTPPSGVSISSADDTVTIAIAPTTALELIKTVAPMTVTGAGSSVDYAFEVTNSGTATLTFLTITETAFTGTGTPPLPLCPSDVLAPGATVTCTATYVTTAADVASGHVDNTATASALAPDQSTVTSDDADASFTMLLPTEPSPSPSLPAPGLPATGQGSVTGLLAIGVLVTLLGSALLTSTKRRATH
ncbi:DUF7507 domain-containing protein [Microbacterium sulfonylureivorans]|uniref:DUF7507 domain-containing protein n=1 Tax=Microbacterium sulfonylureivorans TaxID=2486854 RepID=UPI0013DF1F07|nr:DUF11 domain-containing protein [Microbacterium sulfonylureivorans]